MTKLIQYRKKKSVIFMKQSKKLLIIPTSIIDISNILLPIKS